jgi:hypothetical protein
MVNRTSVALLLVATALAGCATTFYGSAPADDRSLYVVGARFQPFVGPLPAVWLCPSNPGQGHCQRVRVRQ